MHAPLGFAMLSMLVACTLILLICWVHDTYRAAIEAGRSRPVDLEFADSSSREAISAQVGRHLRQARPPFGKLTAKRRVYFVEGRGVWVRTRSANWSD